MSSTKETTSHKRRRHKWKSSFPYKVDYNDHFETPEVAYRDILPLLDFLNSKRDSHVLYDPYYCNGRSSQLLNSLGFSHVVHQCRDFYADISNNTVPAYDTLITNPPYSYRHKEQCLSFALEQLRSNGRPFFILLPNYVAAKDYYRRLLNANQQERDVVYVIPSNPYEYDHPEGTGHASSPFDSIWYCGLGSGNIESHWKDYWYSRPSAPCLVTSLQQLKELKAIPTLKRPNPKQRRKRRKQQADASTETAICASPVKKSKSRHRNEKGERKLRRF
jgi:hypothetical protein